MGTLPTYARRLGPTAFLLCAVAFAQAPTGTPELDMLPSDVREQVQLQLDLAELMRKNTNTQVISAEQALQLLQQGHYAEQITQKRAQMQREIAQLSGAPAVAKRCELGRSYCYDMFMGIGTPQQKAHLYAHAHSIYLQLNAAVPANNYYRLRLQYDLANAQFKVAETEDMNTAREFFRAACIDVLRFPDSAYTGMARTAREQKTRKDPIHSLKNETRSKLQRHIEAMNFAYPDTAQCLDLIKNELPNDPLMAAWADKMAEKAQEVYAERSQYVGFGLHPDSEAPEDPSIQNDQDVQE